MGRFSGGELAVIQEHKFELLRCKTNVRQKKKKGGGKGPGQGRESGKDGLGYRSHGSPGVGEENGGVEGILQREEIILSKPPLEG